MHYDEHIIAWRRFRFMVLGGWFARQRNEMDTQQTPGETK